MSNVIHEFSIKTKKKIFCFAGFLILFLPAMYFKYLSNEATVFNIERLNLVITLQLLAIVPIVWSIRYSRCPACNKNAGYGWKIKQCSNCGQKLVE